MVLDKLLHPISIISVADFGISPDLFSSCIKEYFYQLPWDEYLLRQSQITFLQSNLNTSEASKLTNEFWYYYFQGKVTNSDLQPALQTLSMEKQQAFSAIQPTRRRTISAFNLSFHNNHWTVNRTSQEGYNQNEALIVSNSQYDYRMATRFFKDSPDCFLNDDLFCILEGVANTIRLNLGCNQLQIIVHHNQMVAYPGISASNAPEGIHQDGQDFIVSALVVERENIKGGKSVIFGSDKSTCIVEKTLYPGDGILQPDLNTNLWHTVEPTQSADGINKGFRSTIGFDIEIIK